MIKDRFSEDVVVLSIEVQKILDEARKVCAWANKQKVEDIKTEKILEIQDFEFWDRIDVSYHSCARAYIPSKPSISLEYKNYNVNIDTYYINYTYINRWDISVFGADVDNSIRRIDGAYFITMIDSENENQEENLEWRPPYEQHMDEYVLCTEPV
jgi:hypothetical protein